jgi:hypothetical protein
MHYFSLLFSLGALLFTAACGQKEEEQELDYDNMVMIDEEEEWLPNQGSIIVGEFDPQESLIQDSEMKTEHASEELR